MLSKSIIMSNEMDWRYDCFRIEEDLSPFFYLFYGA